MKKFISISLAMLLCFSTMLVFTSCDDEGTPASNQSWAIYWYLCGSDLETDGAAATNDLAEMMEVELPENVKVIIQTGGANEWQNETISADKSQRYVYDSDGLSLIEEDEIVNMGEQKTLEDFLTFAKENYPADNTMVNFWNHGGGSVTGAAFDEQFENDSLTLTELRDAFTNVYEPNSEDQPIDIIGFDTCLMATLDTANIFTDIGKYLVASEELEPGNGWYYSGFLGDLAKDPTMSPLDLSKSICDTFVEGCEAVDTASDITLSVTNLSKVQDVVTAYNNFGTEALVAAVQDPSFFAHFSQVAHASENYGGNTREQGYTNMVDMGHLASKSADILPDTSQALISSIESAVEYKVNGVYRPDSMGLSCYYSYNGDVDDFNGFAQVSASEAFNYLYSYELTGELPEGADEYLSEYIEYETLPEIVTLESKKWDGKELTLDDDGYVSLDLGKDAYDILTTVNFELYYMSQEDDLMLMLGTDNDIEADWDNGVFTDNFRGVWGSLNGNICYMELAYEGETYNQYTVPIMLNDEEYNLVVIYDYEIEDYYIAGARKPIDESGAADKNLISLQNGDKVQIIHYASSISGEEEELTPFITETVTVDEDLQFNESPLFDGEYVMMFSMYDTQGNVAYSQPVTFEMEDGEIYTSIE